MADPSPEPASATPGGHGHVEHAGVPVSDGIRFRRGGIHDAAAVAALHADSWRRNYRGAYADAFLDGDVLTERLAFWTARLREATADHVLTLAEEDGSLVGFAYSLLDEDPAWGALLGNLHVAHTHQRQRIGTRLMALTAQAVIEQRPSSGLSLWVLEQNVRAQSFYEARGGRPVDRDLAQPPSGDPSRLCGEVFRLRYAWPDAAALLISG